MLEVTEEMMTAFREAVRQGGDSTDDIRAAGIAAVLALVDRDYSLRPALCDKPHPTEDFTYCELPRGHAARSGRGHSATVTKAVDW